jgi:aspartokinase
VSSFSFNNNPEYPWIVQKFGGTSVGKFLDNIANEVIK